MSVGHFIVSAAGAGVSVGLRGGNHRAYHSTSCTFAGGGFIVKRVAMSRRSVLSLCSSLFPVFGVVGATFF